MRIALKGRREAGVDGLDVALPRLEDRDAVEVLARKDLERSILAREPLRIVTSLLPGSFGVDPARVKLAA